MLKLDTTLKKKNMGRGPLAFGSNVHQRSCNPRQLGGLWKHPNISPNALTVSRVFRMLKLDTTREKKNIDRETLAFGPNEPRLQNRLRALKRTYFKHKQSDSSIPSIKLGA